jgi:hypothetical protein
MDNVASLMHGFSVAISFHHIALMIAGVLLGILVGVLPGLGAPNGVSLMLPLTFSMDPVSALPWPRPSTAIRWPSRARRPRHFPSPFSPPASARWPA